MPTRVKDTLLKTFWTMVFAGLGVLTVEAADLPPGYILVAAGVLNVVGAELRKLAGHYAPPPAADAKAQLPETRV